MRRIILFSASILLTLTFYAYSAAQVTIFTIPGCGKCAYLLSYLKNNNIPYTEIGSSDPEHGKKLWAALQKTGSYKGGTVYGPTVIINGRTYYSIENLENFAASIPSLLAGENSSSNRNQDQKQVNTGADSQFITDITERHNYHRRNHTAQPLKWNASIQKYAQSWADRLAAENRMYHRQPNSYGENIYWISGGEVNGNAPVDSWYAEIKKYNYSSPGFSMATGHFTQVVWTGSAELGCGKAKSRYGGTYVVCNYNPPGNYQGMFQKNVLPLKTSGGNPGNPGGNTVVNNQTIKFSDGSTYTGQVKNGKMDGQGTIVFANGDKYTGEWKNNQRDGFGTYTWTNGAWYKGYYKNGRYHGEGTLYFGGKSGKKQTGRFDEGKFVGN